jgi:hypothetical protein
MAVVRSVGAQARDEVDIPESANPDPSVRVRQVWRTDRLRRGSLGAAAAAGLLVATAVAAAPALVVVAVFVAVVGLFAAPRDRKNLLVALVPSAVVAAPFWLYLVRTWGDGGWRLLFAEPGVPAALGDPPAGWQLLLGHAQVPQEWFAVGGGAHPVLAWFATVAPWVFGGLLVVLACAALTRPRVIGGVRTAWLLAASGVVVGMFAVGQGAWPGPGASVVLLGLGGAALLGAPAGREVVVDAEPTRAARLARAGSAVVVTVLVLLPGAGAASWALDGLDGVQLGDLRAAPSGVVPAVGRQMQAFPRSARILQLGVDDGGATYSLLRADGTALIDSSAVVRAQDRAQPDRLDTLVAALGVGQEPGLAAQLADLGIGAVQVAPLVAGDQPSRQRGELVTTLDMVTGLERVTDGDGVLLWRVAVGDEPAPGWARLTDAAPADGGRAPTLAVLPSDGRSVDASVPAAPGPRTLVLAATANSAWHATVDGHRLTAVEADGLQAFEVPPEGGHLSVQLVGARTPLWFGVGGAILLVYVLLALPVGRRRGR